MKTQKQPNLFLYSSLALALAICSPVRSQSEEAAEGKKMGEGKMMEECQAMMDKKKKMMAAVKAQDAELSEQVAKMNSAPDDKKMEMMAGVITKMAEQRITMNERKAKMTEEMMQHMMRHMGMANQSMGHCPMMEGMRKTSMDGEKANQPE